MKEMIGSTAQGGFWIAAMTGVILLTPTSVLASEQRSTDSLPDVLLLEKGELRAKPTLEEKTWSIALPRQVLENSNQVREEANPLDTVLVDQSRDQPRSLGAEDSTDALAQMDQNPLVISTAADLDRVTAVSVTAWPMAQAPTPNPSPNLPTTPGGDEATPVGDEEAYLANLATAAQNPIANLISIPFQNNTNFGVGPNNDQTQNVLNIQPVVPFPLSNDLLLVTRTILPVVAQPDFGGDGTVWGLGDLNPTFFFVPATRSNLTWGIGPTLVLPTATDRQTGTGRWSAGPAGVVVVNSEPWLYGALVSQVWSFAGDESRPDVSRFLIQPFATINLPDGWFLASSPVITADWNASSGDQWTVPIGGGFGRLFMVGDQPINTSLQFFWNAVRPSFGPEFTLRAQVQLLFPR